MHVIVFLTILSPTRTATKIRNVICIFLISPLFFIKIAVVFMKKTAKMKLIQLMIANYRSGANFVKLGERFHIFSSRAKESAEHEQDI